MKILKGLGLGLLALLGIVLILGLIAPREFTVERKTVIEAPPAFVYETVSNFDTWKNWSVWFQMDSTMVITPGEKMQGLGANYSWAGEEMGAGTQTIIEATPGESMKTELDFGMMGLAHGVWKFSPTAEGTAVSWALESRTAYPLNAMILFMDMEESVGGDFEAGLANLKDYVMATYAPPTEPSSGMVSQIENYGPYFLLKKTTTTMAGSEVFMNEEMPALIEAAQTAGIEIKGPPTGIYYSWDMENDRTEMAVALPVAEGATLEGYEVQAIAPGPVVMREHTGGYAGLYDVHLSIDAYFRAHDLEMGTVLEEYHRGPLAVPDSTQWLTRVIYTINT